MRNATCSSMAAQQEDESSKSRHREGYAPSGRPLDYQGGRGWASRVMTRTLLGGTAGAIAGLGIGLIKRQNPLQWLTSVGTNIAISTCCFCGFQELTREIRAADPDDWANSFLGGLASGGLLGRIHGGRARALPTALLFASVGTGIHMGALILREYRLQHLLSSVEQVSDSARAPASKLSKLKPKAWFDFHLPEWFPIQKLDEEAAKRRALEREQQRMKTLESLHSGKFPVEDH